eukprot:TRINITY_DN20599_c0_g1_i2.p1 TRINITY_DN20599_c0_g1~~TRINITY_DN20599_c0_g1_i2.p1  ORF type:complete len:104 (+),score=11.47 TRINITY_DN20599_c0_g1_i2:409-720(+)
MKRVWNVNQNFALQVSRNSPYPLLLACHLMIYFASTFLAHFTLASNIKSSANIFSFLTLSTKTLVLLLVQYGSPIASSWVGVLRPKPQSRPPERDDPMEVDKT